MSNESLEEKVSRLEYYIHQLRDYIASPERFQLWDWSMSHRLNQAEIRGLIDLANEIDSKMKESEELDYPSYEYFRARVAALVYQDEREGFKIIVNDRFIIGFLKGLASMGPFKTLTNYYLTLLKH